MRFELLLACSMEQHAYVPRTYLQLWPAVSGIGKMPIRSSMGNQSFLVLWTTISLSRPWIMLPDRQQPIQCAIFFPFAPASRALLPGSKGASKREGLAAGFCRPPWQTITPVSWESVGKHEIVLSDLGNSGVKRLVPTLSLTLHRC